MGDFTVRVQGLEIPVKGASSQKEASLAVAEAIQSDPKWLDSQRQKFVETGGGATNRFLIGAGREIQGVVDFGRGVAARVTGDDEELARLEAKQAAEDAAFSALDDQGIAAEDLGQAFAWFAPGATGAARGAALLGRAFTSKGIVGKAGNALKGLFSSKEAAGTSVAEVLDTLASPQGKEIAKALAHLAEKNPAAAGKALQAVGRRQHTRVSSTGVRNAARGRPSGTQGVRQAQVKVRRQLRNQDGEKALIQRQEQAAAEEAARALAEKMARSNFSRIEQQAVKQTNAAQLRELIRRAASGQ